jgi:hypothetical protein
MMVPAYVSYSVLAGCVGVIAILFFGLSQTLKRSDWPQSERDRTLWAAGVLLAGWFALAVILAGLNVYEADPRRLPTLQYGIAVPLLVGGFVLWRSSAVSQLIDWVPQRGLIAVQFYRVLGVIFLLLYAAGKLPGLFALPAGAGDVTVGLLAPVVASTALGHQQTYARRVWLWNLVGIADLIVALGTGFLTSPSALQVFAFNPPNELVTVFPLVLIPTFLVPLSILLHVMSLIKLKRAAAHLKTSALRIRGAPILDAESPPAQLHRR